MQSGLRSHDRIESDRIDINWRRAILNLLVLKQKQKDKTKRTHTATRIQEVNEKVVVL